MLKYINLIKFTSTVLLGSLFVGVPNIEPTLAKNENAPGQIKKEDDPEKTKKAKACKNNNGIGNNYDVTVEIPTNSTDLGDSKNETVTVRIDPGNKGQMSKFQNYLATDKNVSKSEFDDFVKPQIDDLEMKTGSSKNPNCSDTSSVPIDFSTVIPEVGGNNACILNWSEVLTSDPNGWITNGGSDGTRNDLQRVYYHKPSGKYVKVSVAQRWDWGGAEGEDPYPYSPKIVDYSKWGTGGFDGEDMFLFSLKTKRNEINSLTLEFFDDSQLTNKASVSDLNFTLTDLDGAGNNEARENIVVSAKDTTDSNVPIGFYKPSGSVIEDSWIVGGSVLGKKSGVTDAKGNIAAVLLEDAHKVEIKYQLALGSKEKNQVRHMYVGDLAWCGETVNVTPDDKVDLNEITHRPFYAD